MFLLRRPSAAEIERFLAASLPLRVSTGGEFCSDQSSIALGHGSDVFDRAWRALKAWKQFALGWVEVFPPQAPVAKGTTVAVLIRHLGFWSLNGARIIDVVDLNGPIWTRGYRYGTLPNHAERGHELFAVSFDRQSGEVRYHIDAHSRPRAALTWCGYPIVRQLQHRFRRESLEAMRRAVG
jgi:uncharacterized protein (UPF0548 family)